MYDRESKRDQLIEKVKTLSPFELKDELINLAKKSERKGVRVLLNAGRGNPNWTASTPRQSIFTLGQFAVNESQRVWCDGDLAGMPEKQGIYDRFKTYYNERKNVEGIELLDKIIDYGIEKHNFEPDSWVFELVDGIIGDNYPAPDRMLIRIKKVVGEYLIKEMGGNSKDETQDLFAVEGGTAAMCYIFDSLIANYLMNKGDKLALMVPIFTPYIDIPDLPRYKFDVVEVRASSMNYLKKIVEEKNPNLIIITDDVYGTFADNFKSLMVTMPFNTLGVYSFSKYFGVTGWRLGVIALAKDNIFNKLISELANDKKDIIAKRYSSLTTEPEKIKFIDRIVADSRHVALNHTAGLSTPLQVQMAIFSIFPLLDSDNRYKEKTKFICRKRKQLLYDNLIGLPIKVDPYSTSYYNQYDLLIWAKMKYGEDFARYLEKERDVIEFLFELVERHSIVLLNGGGFEGPTWSIRVSLANLKDEQYIEIGKAINNLFDEYARDWKESR